MQIAGVMVRRGIPDQKFFGNCPLVSTFLFKIGKIFPVKGNFFSGPKKISNFSLLFFKFQILSDISWSHTIFGAVFGKIGGYFRQSGCMQLRACP